MDEMRQRLQKIKEEQTKLQREFEEVINEYEANELLQENEVLRNTNDEQRSKLMRLQEDLKKLGSENSRLRAALQEQILDEKLNILKVSKAKTDTYFRSSVNPEYNKLSMLEEQSRQEINRLKQRAAKSISEDKQAISSELDRITAEINSKIKKERERLAAAERDLLAGVNGKYGELETEELTKDVMQKRMKQNEIEMKIGLNWINKIGILLIIFGVAAAFRYSYATWFNDYIRGGLFFTLGLIMLAGGEWMYRTKRRTFALGLTGGGIAVLYGSVFFSYFLLGIIGLTAALILSVLITVTAVALSLYYGSRTVLSFGLIGGYIPFYSYLFAFGLEGSVVYAAMAYIFILNGSILWISLQKQWSIVHYLSFILNIPSLFTLIWISPNDSVSLGYTAIMFALYLFVTIGYPFRHKIALNWIDVTLLAFNTFISTAVMYVLFNVLNWHDFRGLLAVTLGILFFALGKTVERTMNREKQTMILFYGTAITFAVLVIPFHFDVQWLALGWLVESVVIMIYANRYKLQLLEKAGWAIFGLTLFTFALDFLQHASGFIRTPDLFHYKYSAVIAGLVLVMVYYVRDQLKKDSTYLFRGFSTFVDGVKYFTLFNVWVYLVYESMYFYDQWVPAGFDHYSFYRLLMFGFITAALGYGLKKIPFLYDRIVKYFCLFLYILGSLAGLFVTVFIPALNPAVDQNTFIDYLALAVLIGFNVLIFATGRDLLLAFIRGENRNAEWYPAIAAVYSFGVLAAFLNVQFQLGEAGFVVSSAYLAAAVGYILYGFKKRYVYVRRLGLGLTLFSTGKLILFDLTFLTEASRIFAYFLFGLMLLGISYIYQKVSSMQTDQNQDQDRRGDQ